MENSNRNGLPESSVISRRDLLKTAAYATPLGLVGGRSGRPQADAGQKAIAGRGDEIADLGARAAVEHIHKGDLKAEAYAAKLLERYHAHTDLNAVITIDEARVLREARRIDEARARGERLGPLAGLPFIVKDQIDVAGYPTTAGHELLKGYVPKQSAAVVDTMTAAGGVVLAKANCNTMVGSVGGNVTSTNVYFGFVRNPYDRTRIPGGSSGGTGAAIAARFVAAGLGEDTGGSVRIPAAFCGIAGLRPSTFSPENALAGTRRKRYADAGIIPTPGLLETIGPMARTVADVAFLDTVITGEPVPVVRLAGARIGIPRADYWQSRVVDPGVEKTTRDVLSRLRDAGARLVEIDLNSVLSLESRLVAGLRRSSSSTLAAWLAANVPGVTADAINKLRNSFPTGAPPAAEPPLSAEESNAILAQVIRDYAAVFQSNDIIALAFPSVLCAPPLINVNGDTPGQKIRVNGQWVDEASYIWSMLFWSARMGVPSLSMPAGLVSGLPVGLLLQGMPGSDSPLLGLGIAVEKVLGPLPPPTSA
jgi:Asp-tRNA(Asn)/Glu-tRNA(Gln) amidotransferase A subunit family amidase